MDAASDIKYIKSSLTQRPATFDDLDVALTLLHTWETHHIGYSISGPERIRRQWSDPDFDLSTSTRTIFAEDGTMVALVMLLDTARPPVRPRIFYRVHPDYQHLDILPELLAWARQTVPRVLARVPDDVRVVLESNALRGDSYSEKALTDAGFTAMNQDWNTMVIRYDQEPAPAQWPTGYTVTTQAEYQNLRAVFDAEHIIFQDHRGATPHESSDEEFRQFENRIQEDPSTDVRMWFLAMHNGEIAGMSLCQPEKPNQPQRGYIWILGVKREHRHKGLGLALLQHSHRALWECGKSEADLIVDGSSLTGANRLYERGGMRVEYGFQTFELELRPGRELTNQG